MKKSVADYIPRKKETKLVQAHLDAELYKKVEHILKNEEWSWPDLVRGLINRWLDEQRENKTKTG